MRHARTTIIALAAALITPLASAGTLTLTVDGVEARGGTLYVGVQTEEQFMEWDGIEGESIAEPTAGSHTVTFDLPAGDYSVSVWHDQNDDGDFGLSESGMPAEGWAMLNGTKLRGAPTFEAVKINVTDAGASASETVIYPR